MYSIALDVLIEIFEGILTSNPNNFKIDYHYICDSVMKKQGVISTPHVTYFNQFINIFSKILQNLSCDTFRTNLRGSVGLSLSRPLRGGPTRAQD